MAKDNPATARARSARWYRNHPEQAKAQRHNSYLRNRDRQQARAKAAREADPEKARVARRRWTIKNKYGITEEQVEAMLARQLNRCAICRVEFTSRPHIDHSHTTQVVRGLLCGPCNKGLGMFRDDSGLLRAAADYLEYPEA